MLQSLCKSLREKARTQPPEQYHHELLLPITPPPMGKTTRRELSRFEKGMIIAFFWGFRRISIVSLITGCPWSTCCNIWAPELRAGEWRTGAIAYIRMSYQAALSALLNHHSVGQA